MELAPDHPNAHDSYAELLQWSGRLTEAQAHYTRAAQLGVRVVRIRMIGRELHVAAHRFEAAVMIAAKPELIREDVERGGVVGEPLSHRAHRFGVAIAGRRERDVEGNVG